MRLNEPAEAHILSTSEVELLRFLLREHPQKCRNLQLPHRRNLAYEPCKPFRRASICSRSSSKGLCCTRHLSSARSDRRSNRFPYSRTARPDRASRCHRKIAATSPRSRIDPTDCTSTREDWPEIGRRHYRCFIRFH